MKTMAILQLLLLCKYIDSGNYCEGILEEMSILGIKLTCSNFHILYFLLPDVDKFIPGLILI